MKIILFRLFTWFQHRWLKTQGYCFGHHVTVSNRGVRKIGTGKILCSNHVNINAEVMFVTFKDITIGKNSTLAYRVLISTSANPNHPYNELAKFYPPIHEEVHIGDNCWIGAGAIILPGVTIGNGSVVAAGAVVNKDVPDNVMVAGVPAVVKKHLKPKE